MPLIETKNIHTNVYGLARSLLALSLLLTLLFTDPNRNFPQEVYQNNYSPLPWNFFLLIGHQHLQAAIAIASTLLILIIIGYLPQITCWLHAWLAISYFDMALVIEGGDQIAQIIAIFIIPIAITDKRINHWHYTDNFKVNTPFFLQYFGQTCYAIIKLQVAVLYFFACVDKFGVAEWRNGSAFYYWFNHNPFGANDTINYLLHYLVENQYTGSIITWSVLILEASLFAAIFMQQKNKKVLLIIALAFHFSILLIHGLGAFFFAMSAALILYLYPYNRSIKLKPSFIKHLNFKIMKSKLQLLR